jgi:hypothetical protein
MRERVRVISPAPRDAWREIVASDPHALVSHAPEWTDALCATGRYADASRLYELRDGRRAVLPMTRRTSVPSSWRVEASLPAAWGIGGLVAPGGASDDDVATVFGELARRRSLRTSVTPSPLQARAWAAARPANAVAVDRLAHVLDLGGGFGAVWKHQFKGSARTAVRKAERAGLSVECDTSGRLVPVFYELFERSLTRWAAQQHEPTGLALWRGRRRDPIRKFELMAAALGESCRLWVAWQGSQAVAAILVLQGRNAHYTRGVMDKQLAGPTRANYLLHSMAIEDACAAGCSAYHMGESGRSRSLAQFKSRFGARPYSYAQYNLERVALTAIDRRARGVVKRMIGFRD